MDISMQLDAILEEVENLIGDGSIDQDTGVKLALLIDDVKADPTVGNLEVLADTLDFLANAKINENIAMLKTQLK